MNDVQSRRDYRKIEINKVGVKHIRYPITVLDKAKGFQHTVASVNLFVDLPHRFKGTHMSRFVEILNKYKGDIAIRNFPKILGEMKRKLKAKTAHLEVEFPYFIEKEAPVTKAKSMMEYICRFCGSSNEKDDFYVGVVVPITTVCPCSKEISQFGAHNQRAVVTVNLRFKKFIWIEDIIQQVEECASCDLYAILKRPDGPTRNSSRRRPTRTPCSSRMWSGRSQKGWRRTQTSPGSRSNRRTSNRSTTIALTPMWNEGRCPL